MQTKYLNIFIVLAFIICVGNAQASSNRPIRIGVKSLPSNEIVVHAAAFVLKKSLVIKLRQPH
jgi:ABC-type metal ion transport system substrate-binding protein